MTYWVRCDQCGRFDVAPSPFETLGRLPGGWWRSERQPGHRLAAGDSLMFCSLLCMGAYGSGKRRVQA